MNEKRIFSLAVLVLMAVAIVLSLVSCADDRLKGIDLYVDYEIQYNLQSDTTDVSVVIDATNANNSRVVRGYKYKLVLKDGTGSTLATRVYTANTMGVRPGSYERLYHDFSLSNGTEISGRVSYVEVIPVEMNLDNEEMKDTDSSEEGSTEWDFWTWLWVIISGVLVYLFFTVCSQEDWDSGMVIGGLIIFILPAIIILTVYFGFFFGH